MIELTTSERAALQAIATKERNGMNGKELQAAQGMERKEALAAIDRLNQLGLCEKNMWNRSVVTDSGREFLCGAKSDVMRDAAAELNGAAVI